MSIYRNATPLVWATNNVAIRRKVEKGKLAVMKVCLHHSRIESLSFLVFFQIKIVKTVNFQIESFQNWKPQ